MTFYDTLFVKHADGIQNAGIQIGLVKENYDEEHKGMVKVEIFYGEEGKTKTSWIRVASPYTANKSGFYALPEIGTEVLVAFINNDRSIPIVIGSLWNDKVLLADDYSKENNNVKAIRTKSGHEIIFDEEEDKGRIIIKTIGKLCISLLDEKKIVKISDDKEKNVISLDFENGEIKLSAENKLIFEAAGKSIITLKDGEADIKTDKIKLEAGQGLGLKGQSSKLEGNTIDLKSDAKLEVKSGATLKLEGSAMTEVKGGMVKIN